MSFDPLLDPDETRDYVWDWSARLAVGETITSHSITVTGCTLGTHTATSTTVTAWLSAAIASRATATCHVTTSAGRQYDDTIQLVVTNL